MKAGITAFYVALTQPQWRAVVGKLSDQSCVVSVDMPWMSAQMSVHEPARSYTWPNPSDGVVIIVVDPEPGQLPEFVRATGNGRILSALDVVGGDVFTDSRSWKNPGSLAPLECPVCKEKALRVLNQDESRKYVEKYAEDIHGNFGKRPSDTRGERWQVNGEDMDAFRCEDCLSVCVNGPDSEGKAVVVRRDVS